MRERPYLAAGALALAVLLLMVATGSAWRATENYLGLRAAPGARPPACANAQRVSLPSNGWRLVDGSFVTARRARPAPNGPFFLFTDNAGRRHCFRPLD